MTAPVQLPASPVVTSSWSVNDVLRYYPSTASVFNAFGLDLCCGAHLTLDAAAHDAGCEADTLLAAIASRVALPSTDDGVHHLLSGSAL